MCIKLENLKHAITNIPTVSYHRQRKGSQTTSLIWSRGIPACILYRSDTRLFLICQPFPEGIVVTSSPIQCVVLPVIQRRIFIVKLTTECIQQIK